MPLDLVVHKPVKGGAEHEMTELPYTRLSSTNLEEGPVFIQAGAFWNQGGEEIDLRNVPQWIWDIVDKWPKRGRDDVGIGTKAEMMGRPVLESRPPSAARTPPPGRPKVKMPTPMVPVTRTDEPEKPEADEDDDE